LFNYNEVDLWQGAKVGAAVAVVKREQKADRGLWLPRKVFHVTDAGRTDG